MADSVCWIWFQLVFGIGTRRAELMLSHFGHPGRIVEELESGGRAAAMLLADERRRARDAVERAERILSRTRKRGCFVCTPDDPDYPGRLQDIYAKPAVLYGRGDLSCLRDSLCVAVVGPRNPSDYGVKAAEMLASGLAASGAVIVSGLANGIDSAAHQAALDAGGKTVGFLGCGLDIDYPKGSAALKTAISQNGAVVTEYPLGTETRGSNFPVRNRMISGVSHGVIVAEASAKSGALLTADHALDQGRAVYAVPGSILSLKNQGGHRLLKEGARLAECAADILMDFPEFLTRRGAPPAAVEEVPLDGAAPFPEADAPRAAPRPVPSGPAPEPERLPLPEGISGHAACLYLHIGGEPAAADRIAGAADLPIPAVLAALTELEIYGLIEMHPGRRFSLKAAQPDA